jgi:AAA family ATPase
LQLELSKLPVSDDVDIEEQVILSEGFSGAEIVSFCNDAVLNAVEGHQNHVTGDNLKASLGRIKPQITIDMLQFYDSFRSKHSF